MSIAHVIFAEREREDGWEILGEVQPRFRPDMPPRPEEALYIGEHDELITVLCGRLPTWWGPHHSGLAVLAKPRGLPRDLSPELAEWVNWRLELDCVDRSSWLLTREVLDFDWYSPSILFSAYAHPSKARLFDAARPDKPFPEPGWPEARERLCGNPWHFERLMSEGADPQDLLYLWRPEGTEEVYWTESHAEYLGRDAEFFETLEGFGPPDKVRLVFWTEA